MYHFPAPSLLSVRILPHTDSADVDERHTCQVPYETTRKIEELMHEVTNSKLLNKEMEFKALQADQSSFSV